MKLKAAAASLVLESVLTARRVVGMSAFEVERKPSARSQYYCS